MAILARRAADVRIFEKDLSTIIVNSSTAAAAMVVVSKQGPSSRPKRYSNGDDFLRDFGQPDARISFDHYSAIKFFEEGNDLYVVRAVGAGAKYSAAIVKINAAGDTVVSPVVGGLEDPDQVDWATLVAAGETPVFLTYAKKGQGSYGDNYAIEVESANLEKVQTLTGESFPTDGSLADGSYKYVVSALSFDGMGLASAPTTHTVAGAGGTARIQLTWDTVENASGYAIYRETLVNGLPTYGEIARIGAATTTYADKGYNTVDVTKEPVIVPSGLGSPSNIFTLKIYDTSVNTSVPQETMVVSLTDSVDETGVQQELVSKLNPFSGYLNVKSNVAALLVLPSLKSTPIVNLDGGTSGAAPITADINNKWNLFLDKEQYVVDVMINSGRTSIAIQHHMDLIARKRGDTIALLDLPSTVQKFQDAVDFRNVDLNLNSSYSALFGPDMYISDPVTSKLLYIPPSGAMAALYARTATQGAPWFSFAGLNRGLVNCLDIRYYYDDGQATALYLAQVNYLRKFLGRGIALWEQSTLLNKASALQFLNVRQLLNIMKRALYSYLLYSIQEPNDAILRRQIKFALEQYLDTVQQGRGISFYRVDTGAALNTPAYVNSGVLRLAISIIPILATREIQLSLIVSKEGLELSEDEISAVAA